MKKTEVGAKQPVGVGQCEKNVDYHWGLEAEEPSGT